MNIRPRRPMDMESVHGLLESAGLPSRGLERTEGWVAEEEGQVIGHVALECTGDAAVLRSLAVAPSAQGRGVARRLMDLAEGQAGARVLVLRTRTIGPWAERRGYVPVPAGGIPGSVRGTTEFEGSLCSGYPVYVKAMPGASRENSAPAATPSDCG